jgi:putative pyoverdin transport system ATP-binding/permease protein
MKLLTFFLRRSKDIGYSKGLVGIVIIAGIIGGVSNTVALALINRALKQQVSSFTSVVWGFIAICVLLAASKAVSQIMLTRLATGAAYDLRVRLSRRILASPLRHLEILGANRMMASLTDDIPNIVQALTNFPNLVINFVIVLGCLMYMGWLSWFLFLVVIGTMAVGVLSYHVLGRIANKYFRQAREAWDLLLKHFHALVEGSKELKLHRLRREEFFSQKLDAAAAALARHRITATTNYAIAENWGEMLVFLVIGLLIFALSGHRGVTAEVLTGYVISILYMVTPLQLVLNTFPTISQAAVAIDKLKDLNELLDAEPPEDDASSLPNPPLQWSKIEFFDVTHAYHRESENNSFTIGPLNLAISVGEVIFITGGNGSGKTTLIKMIAGLYAPETGQVFLDGMPVNGQNRDYYRQHFSAVFSDFYLFDDLLGLELSELDELAREYLIKLQLNHKVQVKNGSLSTVDLSQGQRKRLALLAAYLEDRPIYIFDEWASDQDPLFRDLFYLQLLHELKARGKTILVVSHDDRYYHVADRLIKLDYGQMVSDSAYTKEMKYGENVPAEYKGPAIPPSLRTASS